MKEILRNLCSMGKTILISSHILPELAEMCSSIGIIEHGSMVACGSVEDIQNTLKTSNPVIIKVTDTKGLDDAILLLKENPEVQSISVQELTLSVVLKEEGDASRAEAALLSSLVSSHVPVRSFYREEGNLESLFMQITAEQEP